MKNLHQKRDAFRPSRFKLWTQRHRIFGIGWNNRCYSNRHQPAEFAGRLASHNQFLASPRPSHGMQSHFM